MAVLRRVEQRGEAIRARVQVRFVATPLGRNATAAIAVPRRHLFGKLLRHAEFVDDRPIEKPPKFVASAR